MTSNGVNITVRSLVGTTTTCLKYLLGLAEILLGVRLLLKFLAARSEALVVDALYRVTDLVIVPFRGIFDDLDMGGGSVIDLSALSAMVGYAIGVYLIIELIELLFRSRPLPPPPPKGLWPGKPPAQP